MNLPFTPIESPVGITLDIETSDTAVTARILTIGAVAANLLTGERLGTFYVRIALDQPERTSSDSTLAFWEQQRTENPDAHKEAWSEELSRESLQDALPQFNAWVKSIKKHPQALDKGVSMLGNGCEFDNAIVIHAMEQHGLKQAWRFRDNDSVRTLVRMGRLLLGIDPKHQLSEHKPTHHALEDAQHELEYVLHIINALLNKLYPQ
jgi:hypothetical protein